MVWQLDGPNDDFLRVQGRVCTGPHQSRPLGLSASDDLQPAHALELVLKTCRKTIPPTARVSLAQMGAFFTAMHLRRSFEGSGAWNDVEQRAFSETQQALLEELPPTVAALVDPTEHFAPSNHAERALWPALQTVLGGEHLGTSQTKGALDLVLSGEAPPAFAAALLIGQRMNIETPAESLAYLQAGAPTVTDISLASLTHVGQPYNGSTRGFRPALFAAAVSAELGMPTLLHGVRSMPPKDGITAEQMIRALGQNAPLNQAHARRALLDDSIRFAFVDQRLFSPERERMIELRYHIKKRPVFATTEKMTLLFRATGQNHMVGGYFHPGYDERMLSLMRTHDLDTEIVFKGREGSTDPSLRARRRQDAHAMNQTTIRSRKGSSDHETTLRIDPAALGIHHATAEKAPTDAEHAARLGTSALQGCAGHARDGIALSAAIKHHLITRTTSLDESLRAAYTAIDEGGAWGRLQRYLARSTEP